MKFSDHHHNDWDGTERREYFRLDDRALLGIEVIEQLQQINAEMGSLQQLEQQISTLLYRVESKDSELAQLLKLMNQKLNRVAGLELDPNVAIPDHPVDINLSACGIRFVTSMNLQQAEYLRLHLTLLPDHANLVLDAHLVELEVLSNTGLSQVRAAFANLTEADREVLIQHMMQLQRRQMKAAAEQRQQVPTDISND
ncbi:PilZ domain-containing protein [Oceanobacter mangrovi]|uniref:PilZ domain-containing protein n=1 Tax=Oceanobacter mangrovi TaxID=2862510 RepID=UPI001C8D8532|nr:PilZ domain-containing protein [Oceanobacter mangrovi]